MCYLVKVSYLLFSLPETILCIKKRFLRRIPVKLIMLHESNLLHLEPTPKILFAQDPMAYTTFQVRHISLSSASQAPRQPSIFTLLFCCPHSLQLFTTTSISRCRQPDADSLNCLWTVCSKGRRDSYCIVSWQPSLAMLPCH